MDTPKVITIAMPEYTLDRELDYEALGSRLDRLILDRGYSVRIDIMMVYSASALLPAVQVANNRPSAAPYAKYLYRFRPDVPHKGLQGIVVIE